MEELREYQAALEKALSWLLSLLNEDGTMNPRERGPLPYYKVPRAMLAGGKIREAVGLLEWAKRESFTEEGDFAGPRLGFHSGHYAYSNAWLVWAAHLLGRFDISYPGKNFLFRFVNPCTGGSCSNTPFSETCECEQDLLSTSFNAFVGLYFGEVEVARRASAYLRRFLGQQPDLEDRMWLRSDGRGKLIEHIPEGCQDPGYYVLDAHEPSQYYYFVGAPIFFLCKLHQLAGGSEHLSTAKAFFEFADSCGEHAYSSIFTAKVGLGAAHLFQATGEERYREAALRSFNFLLSKQTPQGCWVRDDEPWVSITAELCVWLSEVIPILR